MPLNTNPDYRLLHPMKYGELNTHDYSSIQQVIGDLQVIWTDSIKSELEIEDKDFRVSFIPLPSFYNLSIAWLLSILTDLGTSELQCNFGDTGCLQSS